MLAEDDFTKLGVLYEKEQRRKFLYNDPVIVQLTNQMNIRLVYLMTGLTMLGTIL
jgi:hypothetical protein